MLCLISLGLFDEKDISLRGLEAAKACSKLYLERYTTETRATAEKLKKLTGRPVKELPRSGFEEQSGRLISKAKTTDIGIFVGGDALSATTHISLLQEAKKAGLETRVIHGSSIFTAVAATGLQLYKFGRTVTLVNSETPSVYSAISENLKAGLHTLVLLDIGMPAKAGLKILMELEKKAGKGFLPRGLKVAVCCSLGSREETISYGPIGNLLKTRLPEGTAVIAIPGRLHFSEEEFLETFSL
jgi:diphthine synthase